MLKKISKFIYNNYKKDKYGEEFISTNIKLINYKNNNNNKKIILTEYTNLQPLVIGISYFLRLFNKDQDHKTIGYLPYFHKSFFDQIKFFFLKNIKSNNIRIFQSLGINEIIYFDNNSVIQKLVETNFTAIYKNLSSKKQLEK